MALAKSKVSGKAPVLQTRQEHHDAELAAKEAFDAAEAHKPARLRRTFPMPHLVKAGDVAAVDANGNKLLVRDEDINTTDVRLVDPDDWSHATPWVRAKDQSGLEEEWNYLNAQA